MLERSEMEVRHDRPLLMQLVRSYCVPLLYFEFAQAPRRRPRDRDMAICGGSALLWQAKNRRFIVTAAHVWAEFEMRLQREAHRRGIFVGSMAGPVVVRNVSAVARDDRLDLAVLTYDGIENAELTGKAFFRQPIWPKSGVYSGETVAFFGHPKAARGITNQYAATGAIYLQGKCTVSQTGESILMNGKPDAKFIGTGYHIDAPMNYPGASGAAVFAVRARGPEWVGVVRSGGPAPHHDIQITPSKFINDDGSISYPHQ